MADEDRSLLLECEQEPLANSGLIQSHGVLLFIDKKTGRFSAVSRNSESLLGEAPEGLLGLDGHEWLDLNLPELATLPTSAGQRAYLCGGLDMGLGELDVLISPTRAGWMLDFETLDALDRDPDAHQIMSFTPPLDAEKLHQLQDDLVRVVSAVTGYDRVMLYRFRPDWSGEVLAETVRISKGTYLGLRFPASDIPAIARALYAQTPYRYIPDVTAAPVALSSLAGDGTQLDLTWSDLRSVSPVHLQYLKNMQVLASFSVSIVLEGKLWGLIACHHPEPKTIALQCRRRCQALAAEFGESLQQARASARRAIHSSLATCLGRVKSDVEQGRGLSDAIMGEFATLAMLFDAPSGAVMIDQDLTLLGEPWDAETLRDLHHWCLHDQGESVFAMDHVPETLNPLLSARGRESFGFLSIGLRAKTMNNAPVTLYLLRPEESSEIAWAGNPEKPMESTNDGLLLSPRHSFEKWVEVRHGYSRAWDEDSLFAANQLREQLMIWL